VISRLGGMGEVWRSKKKAAEDGGGWSEKGNPGTGHHWGLPEPKSPLSALTLDQGSNSLL
jgi:hypothetical protein